MRLQSWAARCVLAAGIVALAWPVTGAAGVAATPAFRTTTSGSPALFFQQPSAPALPSQSGGGRGHLPTSVMPNGAPGLRCSVDTTDPGAPPSCSTASVLVRCSAHCDNLQFCSAIVAPSGPIAICSTLGGTKTNCSVLQPVITPTGASQCSAFGGLPGTSLRCSVMGAGWKQACSAENPAQNAGNQCSTFNFSGAIGGAIRCSVLQGGSPLKNRCSVGSAVPPGFLPKQCSAFAQNSRCSIQPGNSGACTVFAPAPTGTCSAFATPATCSVIGGASGGFCFLP